MPRDMRQEERPTYTQLELFQWTQYFTILVGKDVKNMPTLYRFYPTKSHVHHSPYLFIWRLDYDPETQQLYWTELRTINGWEVSAPPDEARWCGRFLVERARALGYEYKVIDTLTEVELSDLKTQSPEDRRTPRWDEEHLYDRTRFP